MPARVQIILEAKDAASGVLRGITSQLGGFGRVMEDLTSANVNWGNLAASAAQLVANGMKQAIEATTQYAEDVRDLSLLSGQSAEETSRMVQVMDDFQLTADDAAVAIRTLTKEGLAPTIGTMAELADQYVKLNSAQEKNEFILKNLGRSGLQWANMLSKGGDAIREMADNVNQSLILTDENIKAAEDYRLALDNWNDSVQGLKVSIGNELLPALTNLLDVTLNLGDASEETQSREDYARMSIFERAKATLEAADAMGDESRAAQAAVRAVTDLGTAEGDAVDPAKALADAQKELSRANQAILSNMFALQSASEEYTAGEEERAAKLREIEAEKIRLALEMNALRSKGELTMSRQNELIAQQLELEQQAQSIMQEGTQAIEDQELARKRMIYNMLEQKLAQDGITDTRDVEYLQNTAVQMGLVDRNAADAAISAAKMADALYDGFTKNLPPLTVTQQKLDAIAAYNGRTIGMTVFASIVTSLSGTSPILPEPGERRAAGGPVYAGQPYIVGENGPEMFVPRQSGDIVPGGGRNVTININGTFTSANDLNYLAQEVARRIAA